MEKSLYQAPQGLTQFSPEQEGIEIEIDIAQLRLSELIQAQGLWKSVDVAVCHKCTQ